MGTFLPCKTYLPYFLSIFILLGTEIMEKEVTGKTANFVSGAVLLKRS